MLTASLTTLFEDEGLATREEFSHWLRAWRASIDGGATDSMLSFFAREKGVSEDEYLDKVARILNWERVDILQADISREASMKLSPKVAFQFTVMPVSLEEDLLTVAVCDPFDLAMLNSVRFDARCMVKFQLASQSDIEKTLKKYYGVGAETLTEMAEDDLMDLDISSDKEITEGDQDASVIKFVNQIIWEAFKDRATDIHFEPAEDELRIRYRIDGLLYQTPMPPQLKRFQASIISRIKVMSGMNISEKRLPQDGRINVRIKGEEIDIRVSTVPTVYGESVSLRLLTRGKIFLSLDKLGFNPRDEMAIREIIVKPHGIFLVTGPTGSGKSTSLYAFLSSINSVHKRIITVEEPVEYELKGINQIAVRPDIGLTFAKGLRHILRQDPNVIMVGEIRDLETAEIAIQASLTGHLVLSTLHTNDAASAFTRLIDMGIEPFLVATSVEAVMAQRLVRTICKNCATAQNLELDYLKRIGYPANEIATTTFYKGIGCEQCRMQGYKGRMGIYELLLVTEELRTPILSRSPSSTISQIAIEQGMRLLRVDGWEKVKLGLTTVEEVLRVTQVEQHLDHFEEITPG
ncbi:MAG: GspE/PulE family protein [Verrucomicrobia bacterium]|nr:GspE/PulE family protein [Verrucomicrobiota bacterium]